MLKLSDPIDYAPNDQCTSAFRALVTKPRVQSLRASFTGLYSQKDFTQGCIPRRSDVGDTAYQLFQKKLQRFRGGLVFKAHRLLYHSTLGSRVIKKKEMKNLDPESRLGSHCQIFFRVIALMLDIWAPPNPNPNPNPNLKPKPLTPNP